MNVRKLFRKLAATLQSQFRETTEAYTHNSTKGSAREDILREFLEPRLPARFGIGRGQVVGAKSPDSRESDLILYDTLVSAPIVVDSRSQVHLIEGVSGIIEVKSALSKAELIDALNKIADFKALAPKGHVARLSGPVAYTERRHLPFGVVFAFSLSNNSLDSLQENLLEYEAALPDRILRPNLIVVLDEGIIVHLESGTMRNLFLSDELGDRDSFPIAIKHKQWTLFEFYVRLLHMLMNTKVEGVDFERYVAAPERLGSHIVRNHDRFTRRDVDGVFRLSEAFIDSVVQWCADKPSITTGDLDYLVLGQIAGNVPAIQKGRGRGRSVKLYNPNDLPGLTPKMLSESEGGVVKEPCLVQTVIIEIDGESYGIPAWYVHGNTVQIPGATYDDL